jgi:hypothetical protein
MQDNVNPVVVHPPMDHVCNPGRDSVRRLGMQLPLVVLGRSLS